MKKIFDEYSYILPGLIVGTMVAVMLYANMVDAERNLERQQRALAQLKIECEETGGNFKIRWAPGVDDMVIDSVTCEMPEEK